MVTKATQTPGQTLTLLLEARAHLDLAIHALNAASGQKPPVSAADARRVAAVGEDAHLHLLWHEQHPGQHMTRSDSLALRKQLHPGNVRATANQFGKPGSNAILLRTAAGPVKDDDPVVLTDEGRRLALLWRDLHPGWTA